MDPPKCRDDRCEVKTDCCFYDPQARFSLRKNWESLRIYCQEAQKVYGPYHEQEEAR